MGDKELNAEPLRQVPNADLALAIAGVGISAHKAIRLASTALSTIAIQIPDVTQQATVTGAASAMLDANKELADRISELLSLMDPEEKSNAE